MHKIYDLGIRSLVVIGVFSSLDIVDIGLEDEVKSIIRESFDDIDVVCFARHRLDRLLERERLHPEHIRSRGWFNDYCQL